MRIGNITEAPGMLYHLPSAIAPLAEQKPPISWLSFAILKGHVMKLMAWNTTRSHKLDSFHVWSTSQIFRCMPTKYLEYYFFWILIRRGWIHTRNISKR